MTNNQRDPIQPTSQHPAPKSNPHTTRRFIGKTMIVLGVVIIAVGVLVALAGFSVPPGMRDAWTIYFLQKGVIPGDWGAQATYLATGTLIGCFGGVLCFLGKQFFMNIRYASVVAGAFFIILILFPPSYTSYDLLDPNGKRTGGEGTVLEIRPLWQSSVGKFVSQGGPFAERGLAYIKNEKIALASVAAAVASILLISLFLGVLARRKKPLLRVFSITAATLILLAALFYPHTEYWGISPTKEVTVFKPVWVPGALSMSYFVGFADCSIILSALLGIFCGRKVAAEASPPSQQITCPKCNKSGHEIDRWLCWNCGAELPRASLPATGGRDDCRTSVEVQHDDVRLD